MAPHKIAPVEHNAPVAMPTPPEPKPAPRHTNRAQRYAFRIVLLAILGGVAYGLWQNPRLVEQIRSRFAPQPQEDPYASKFTNLQDQIAALNTQLAQTNFKLDNSGFYEVQEELNKIEQMNLNVINSKADAAAVLGVITRLDSAEQKINNLSAVTDSSALLLTGVLLVKDAAERGRSFEYEAEVLAQIAAENPKALPLVKKLQTFAANGILSDLELATEFEQLAAAYTAPQPEPTDQNWKDRLNTKLGEIVQIKKKGEQEPVNLAQQTFDSARTLIKDNKLLRAANLLAKSPEIELKNNQELQTWIQKINQREEFYKAISALSADSLAALKVNNLHKVRGK